MREFFILLKYGIALSNISRGKNKKASLYSAIIPAILIGFVSFMITKNTFEILSNVDPLAPYIFINFWTTLISIFFIVGFVGLAVNSFTLNEEIEFLLNLPIRRSTIAIYQIFTSTVSQFFALFLYIGVYISYVHTYNFGFSTIIKGLLQIVFMISFASILTILIGKKIKRAIARKIVTVANVITPFLIFILIGSNWDTTSQVRKLGILKYIDFSLSNCNFLTWSIKDGIVFPISSLMISLIFIVVFIFLSKNLEFMQRETRKVKRIKIKGGGSPIKAIYIKDIKTAIRIDQFIFFIIYPLGFGIFMSILNADVFTAIFSAMPIIIIYVALESAILTAKEYLYIETVKTYPVNFGKLLVPKISIPTILNTLILFMELVIFSILKGLQLKFFVFLPISFVLLIMSSLMGAYEIIKNPPKTENMSRILGFGPIMLVEGVTLGSVFAIIFPIMKVLTSDFQSKLYLYLVGYLLPTATLIACMIYSYYLYKKIKEKVV